MAYKSLEECIIDLDKNGHLVRIKEEVDPYLEMAAIHRRVYANQGPAILFEKVKECEFRAVSNLFGTLDRCKFMFRDTLEGIKELAKLKDDPLKIIRQPLKHTLALKALPKKSHSNPVLYQETQIDKLPQIHCWPNDGGTFVLLPQVYTEDIENPGVKHSNVGCYRIQMSGNQYILNKEIGLHYQIHRGIGVHQAKANVLGVPMKVSIFAGGPPAHSFAAVMPLPEGLSELAFAGALGGRNFRYTIQDGYVISSDADFVITGEVHPNENKPEGPFGDHLGYYSLKHDFPVMRVHKVWHRKDAIWPFTVVGRPPQEDSQFGALIHEITGPVIPKEIPGLKAVRAVDEAGVHPLLLAIGSERYTPYLTERRPQEILTIANHILGTGQLSLSKYLMIVASEDNPDLDIRDAKGFLRHLLERVDWTMDLHFQTNTTIDTLDYSGEGLNSGSKVVIAAAGVKKRELATGLPGISWPGNMRNPQLAMPGVLVFESPGFVDSETTSKQIAGMSEELCKLADIPLMVMVDDSREVAANFGNFLWVTFTRSIPARDIHGVNSFVEYKHWGCRGPLIIDARAKPHHAPLLEPDPEIEKKVDALGAKGASLHGII